MKITQADFTRAELIVEDAVNKVATDRGVSDEVVLSEFFSELEELQTTGKLPPADSHSRIQAYLTSFDECLRPAVASNPELSNLAAVAAVESMIVILDELAKKHQIPCSGYDLWIVLMVAANR